jgi:hypothetical protein
MNFTDGQKQVLNNLKIIEDASTKIKMSLDFALFKSNQKYIMNNIVKISKYNQKVKQLTQQCLQNPSVFLEEEIKYNLDNIKIAEFDAYEYTEKQLEFTTDIINRYNLI